MPDLPPDLIEKLRGTLPAADLLALGIAPAPAPPAAMPAGLPLVGAPLPAKLRNFYRHTYADYALGTNGAPNYRNSKDGRTVKRWVSNGRNAIPHDLPPLDDPPRMAAWFRKRFPREPVPAILLDYETSAPKPPAPLPASPTLPSPSGSATAGDTAPGSRMTAIDFAALDPDADASVRRAAIIEAANGQRVKEASESGDADAYRKWFPIWKESANLLRQLSKEDREARQSSGALLDRAAVLAELSQLVEALRIMSESMPAKILAELERHTSKRIRRIVRLLAAPLKEATDRARDPERAIFQNLETLASPDTAREILTLKAA